MELTAKAFRRLKYNFECPYWNKCGGGSYRRDCNGCANFNAIPSMITDALIFHMGCVYDTNII